MQVKIDKNTSVFKIRDMMNCIQTDQELIEIYNFADRKFIFAEDTIYDFEEGSNEYELAIKETDEWLTLVQSLLAEIVKRAKAENLYKEREPNSGIYKQIEGYMNKYGYFEQSGWWIHKDDLRSDDAEDYILA